MQSLSRIYTKHVSRVVAFLLVSHNRASLMVIDGVQMNLLEIECAFGKVYLIKYSHTKNQLFCTNALWIKSLQGRWMSEEKWKPWTWMWEKSFRKKAFKLIQTCENGKQVFYILPTKVQNLQVPKKLSISWLV